MSLMKCSSDGHKWKSVGTKFDESGGFERISPTHNLIFVGFVLWSVPSHCYGGE